MKVALLPIATAALVSGCGFTIEENEKRCQYESQKAAATISDDSNRRIRGYQLEHECMKAAGFSQGAKGWHRSWLSNFGLKTP